MWQGKMINFNKPIFNDDVLNFILDSFRTGKVSGDGKYTKLCSSWMEKKFKVLKALFTCSCTASLEMSAILSEIKPGDEVIMPSFTFVSTANAFVMLNAKPVFVDIRSDTLNINERLIESAITNKTKAIVPVHYAGVGCEMDTITEIAKYYKLLVIEDAAQCFDSYYKGKHLGTIGDMGCFSFHETKNVMSGEGGAFVTNNPELAERAEIIREKGTNRSKYFRGQVDKYTWVDKGSSYLPSDINAAYLWAMFCMSDEIQKKRKCIWETYNQAFSRFESKGVIRRPIIPDGCTNNAHMFYLIFQSIEMRTKFIKYMNENGIMTPFHYIPLHSSPAGLKYGSYCGQMNVTNKISDTLVRLPLYYELGKEDVEYIVEKTSSFLRGL